MNLQKVNTLEDVRQNIDRIDEQIVSLLGERQFYVGEAVQFKTSTVAVKDSARVEAVIAKVRNLAVLHNLDPNIAESVYRTMIDCFINKELNDFQKNR